MPRARPSLPDRIAIDMTPMIDVVFQLITFFMLTLKDVAVEGDFDVKMPLGPSQGAVADELIPPIRVRMTAAADGSRSGLSMNGQPVDDFDELRRRIVDLVGTGPGSHADQAEVELDCDYGLKYANVVQAITAVSGMVQPDGTVVELVKKIKFTPPKQPE